jgi:hypothetical protein
MRRTRTVILAALPLALACSSATDAPTRCDGTDPVAVSIAAPHTTPRFSWTGSCGIWTLQVSYVDSTSTVVPVWGITTPGGANTIFEPITYGVTPAGATGSTPAALVAGQAYRVQLSAWNATLGRPAFVGVGNFLH